MKTEEYGDIAKTISELALKLGDVELLSEERLLEGGDLTKPFLVSIPAHREVQDLSGIILKAFEQVRPLRRRGTTRLQTINSLIDWCNRFKSDEGSVLFMDKSQTHPSMTCIANYHHGGPVAEVSATGDAKAAHGDHRGLYHFPVSREWARWTEINQNFIEKDEFGYFLEERAEDLCDPTPFLTAGTGKPTDWEQRLAEIAKRIDGRFGTIPELMGISREFTVNESTKFTIKSDRNSGTATVQFINEHNDPDGKPIKIPNLFIIVIPVFEGGQSFRIPVRLSYRKSGASLKFRMSLYNPERAWDLAIESACKEVSEKTNLPLMYGKPE